MAKVKSAKLQKNLHKMCGTTPTSDLQPKEVIAYSIAGFGQNLICALVTTYLMLFLTDGVGLAASLLSWLFLGTRLFDAFNDPIMGSVVDHTKTVQGKFRPFLLYGALPIALFTILCFVTLPAPANDDLRMSGRNPQFIWASVMYVLWSVAYTVVDVPYWGLSTALSGDTYQRSNILTVARLVCTLGAGIIQVFIPVLTGLATKTVLKKNLTAGNFALYENFLSDPKKYPIDATSALGKQIETLKMEPTKWVLFSVAVVICILSVPMFYHGFKNTKERFLSEDKPTSLGHNIKSLFKNKPLMLVAATGILGSARYIYMSSGMYYAKHVLNDESLFSLITILVLPGGLIASVLTPFFSKKLGKKWTFISSHIFGGVALILLYFVGLQNNGTSTAAKVVGIIVLIFVGIPSGFSNIMTYAMIADTVEYFEDKYGERLEGVFFAMQTFISKIGFAVCAFALLFALGKEGYDGTKLVIGEREKKAIWMVSTLIPGISHVACVIPLFFYTFTEDKQQEVMRKLEKERHIGEVNLIAR